MGDLILKPKDKIIALGEIVIISKILFQSVDLGKGAIKAWADVEFEDEKGNYRHWQSWSDGGKIITANGQEYKFEKEVNYGTKV